jgi:hypothetical protein
VAKCKHDSATVDDGKMGRDEAGKNVVVVRGLETNMRLCCPLPNLIFNSMMMSLDFLAWFLDTAIREIKMTGSQVPLEFLNASRKLGTWTKRRCRPVRFVLFQTHAPHPGDCEMNDRRKGGSFPVRYFDAASKTRHVHKVDRLVAKPARLIQDSLVCTSVPHI